MSEALIAVAMAIASEQNNERGFEVLARRRGLYDGRKATLKEIGASLGVSSERTRQLGERLWCALLDVLLGRESENRFGVPKSLLGIVDEARRQVENLHPFVLRIESLQHILGEMRWSPGQRAAGEMLLDAWGYRPIETKSAMGVWVHVGEGNGREHVGEVFEAVHGVLSKEAPYLSMEALTNLASARCGRDLAVEDVAAVVSVSPELEAVAGGLIRMRFDALPGLALRVRRLLEEEGSPLHFRQVTDRLNERTGAQGAARSSVTSQAVRAMLSSNESFVPIGCSGMWALRGWEHVCTEPIKGLIVRALEGRRGGATIDEVHAQVLGCRPNVPRATIQVMLSVTPGLFRRVGRGRYSLASSSSSPAMPVRRSSQAVGEGVRRALLDLIEERETTVFLHAHAVRAVVSHSGIPAGTVRLRLDKAPWVTKGRDRDGRIVIEVHAGQLRKLSSLPEPRVRPVFDRIEATVRAFLEGQPGQRALLAAVCLHTVSAIGVQRPSVYHVVSEMDGLEKERDGRRVYCRLRAVPDLP